MIVEIWLQGVMKPPVRERDVPADGSTFEAIRDRARERFGQPGGALLGPGDEPVRGPEHLAEILAARGAAGADTVTLTLERPRREKVVQE